MPAAPTNDTFSVELLGFSPHVSPQDAAVALAKVFGMDPARAVAIVRQAPVRVKGNAPPDVARRLATALLGIEANVRVKNEKSGAVREYFAQAVAADGPPSALREPPDAAPHSARPPAISYIPGELGAYVPPGAPDPRAVFSAAHAATHAAPPPAPDTVPRTVAPPPASGAAPASTPPPASAPASTPPPASAPASTPPPPPSARQPAPPPPSAAPDSVAPVTPAPAAVGAARLGSGVVGGAAAAPPPSGRAAVKSPASHANVPLEGETFTVFLLGFSSSTSELESAQALSRVFGMDVPRAAALVKQVPVRVKGKATPEVARRLATALLGIEANLRIKSDLTGEEREYHAAGVAADGPPSALREVPDATGRPPAISYMPGELGAYVPPGEPDPRAVFTAAHADHPPPSTRDPSAGAASARSGSVRPPPGVGPDSTHPPSGVRPLLPVTPAMAARLAEAAPPSGGAGGEISGSSLAALAGALGEAGPPPQAAAAAPPPPPPPTPAAGPVVCSSCHKPHAADVPRCPRCGYSRKTHVHECIACGGRLVAGHSIGVPHFAVAGVLGIGALAAAWYLGFATGAGFALAPIAALAFGRAQTAAARCKSCHKPAPGEGLPDALKKEVQQTRTLQALLGGVLLLLATGPGFLYIGQPQMVHEAAQAKLVASVPRTHRSIEQEAIDVSTGFAVGFGTMHQAANAHLAIETFRLVYIDIPNARVAVSDQEALMGVLTGTVADLDATPDPETKPLPAVDKVLGTGVEATFTGPGGLRGRALTRHAGHGYVTLLFAGRGPAVLARPEGDAFLTSLHH